MNLRLHLPKMNVHLPMANVYLPYENVGAGGATYPLWKAAIKVSSSVCPIPELISDLDGLIPAVKVAGVALCGEVWLKPPLLGYERGGIGDWY